MALTPQRRGGGRRPLSHTSRDPARVGGTVVPVGAGAPNAEFRLVGPAEVVAWLSHGDGGRTVLLEAHFTSGDHPADPAHPNDRHLPGAIQVHPSYIEAGLDAAKYYPRYDAPEDATVLPHADLTKALERLGIAPASRVVVYGCEPDGAMAAARVVWGLLYAGVAEVRLLDGGVDAWLACGGQVSSRVETVWGVAASRPEGCFSWRAREEYLATTDHVRWAVACRGSAAIVVDVRNKGERDGSLIHHYQFFESQGHIPTAVHQGDWKNLLEPSGGRIGPALADIQRRWRELGVIDAEVEGGRRELIFYCGTGWRSSVAFLTAKLLGLRARNYDGGYFAWTCGRSPPPSGCGG